MYGPSGCKACSYIARAREEASPDAEAEGTTGRQSWGRSLIFDLKIKDPSNFADLLDDLNHTRGSDLINGDLDQKITL